MKMTINITDFLLTENAPDQFLNNTALDKYLDISSDDSIRPPWLLCNQWDDVINVWSSSHCHVLITSIIIIFYVKIYFADDL